MSSNSNVLLLAYHFNCGLMIPGTGQWRSTTFKVLYCGDMCIKVRHQINSVDEMFQISSEELESLKRQLSGIKAKPTALRHDIDDGAMWDIQIYDKEGNIDYDSGSGYIDGIETIEALSQTLYKFVPKYKEPDMENPPKAIPIFHVNEITYDGEEIVELATYLPAENKDYLMSFLRGFDPECHCYANGIYDRVFNKMVSNTKNYSYRYRKYYWNEEMIYHFEKYNIPLNLEFKNIALLRIDVPDIVYVIKKHRMGTVVDRDSHGKYTVECCNIDSSEGTEERYSLYYDLDRSDLRLIKVCHQRKWNQEVIGKI